MLGTLLGSHRPQFLLRAALGPGNQFRGHTVPCSILVYSILVWPPEAVLRLKTPGFHGPAPGPGLLWGWLEDHSGGREDFRNRCFPTLCGVSTSSGPDSEPAVRTPGASSWGGLLLVFLTIVFSYFVGCLACLFVSNCGKKAGVEQSWFCSSLAEQDAFLLFIFNCVCVRAHVHMWGSEGTWWELVFFLYRGFQGWSSGHQA